MSSLQIDRQPSSDRRAARMTASSGRVYFWQGGSLWIGEGQGQTHWHAHHAHQLTLAKTGHVRFRTEAEGRWTTFEGAIVPSHCTHQLEADSATMAHLFVEPESRAGRALTRRHGSTLVSDLPAAQARMAARQLFDALSRNRSDANMVPVALATVASLCGASTETDQALDRRLVRALDFVRANVRRPISLADAASAATLSESHFRHLFVAATGSSFRAYLLWLRINLAIDAAMKGASWTEAAHEAGFADSAHLARTHKRMFGIEPTALPAQPRDRSAS